MEIKFWADESEIIRKEKVKWITSAKFLYIDADGKRTEKTIKFRDNEIKTVRELESRMFKEYPKTRITADGKWEWWYETSHRNCERLCIFRADNSETYQGHDIVILEWSRWKRYE